MPRERLSLCCGIQCTDSLHPNGPRQRRKLFTAALKLLRFAIGIETVCCENEEQRALQTALLPLLQLEDGHVLATLSAIVLALCEGRTGLAISGVFGARKTRSAAALLAGLLVFDPSLQLMVLTKENVAAHAVAEHLVSLQLPDRIQGKMGRLVGYYEQNRKGSYTPLDILPSNRNQVIRQKSLRQKWGLALSSSARVSQVTYQTVVGVRYPELVTFNGTSSNFGKFVTPEKPRRGGFLPVFWDVPRADTHAVEDIGGVVKLTERCAFHADAKSSLAVLHNRNDMTKLFRASN